MSSRTYHILERDDGSTCVYYTLDNDPAHYVVYDTLDERPDLAAENERLRAAIARLESEITIQNDQNQELRAALAKAERGD